MARKKTKEPLKNGRLRGRKRGASGFLHPWVSAGCWCVAFIEEGLAGEAPAHSSAISTSKGLGGGGSGSLYFCSEATFQDDVVAIAALGCKRKTLGMFQEEGHGATALEVTEGMVGGYHRSPAMNIGSDHQNKAVLSQNANKCRDVYTCFCICLVEFLSDNSPFHHSPGPKD